VERSLLSGGIAAGLLAFALPGFSLIDHLVFHPTPGADLTLEDVGAAGSEVFFEAEDGVRLHAWLLQAEGARRALLLLHGNAGNASHRLPIAERLARLGVAVLLLDYRGYGLSEGRPTERGVYADARAALAYLVDGLGFPERRVIVFGSSLGAAVAVDLARGRKLAGMILESPFPSLSAMAREVFGTGFGPLTRGRFDSLAKIGELRSPLLFLHGDRDEIVPYALGRALYDAAPEPKRFTTIRGAGHNDTVAVGGAAYFQRIGAFLDEVAPP
jgi:hypothetical protein